MTAAVVTATVDIDMEETMVVDGGAVANDSVLADDAVDLSTVASGGPSVDDGDAVQESLFLYVLDDEVIVSSLSAPDASHLPTFLNGSEPPGTRLPDDLSRYRWLKNCSSSLENVNLEDPRVIGSLIPLGIICLVVIFGNAMVIAAVRMTSKLRGATNLFIVSLAWADLTLGLVVLPSSASYEVFGLWIFGDVWCSIWLAVDVWTCTASILHLVVISLDRFIAVTHPITYPNIMTTKRAKLLILGAWVLSFVICFPPLVGWDSGKDAEEAEAERLAALAAGNSSVAAGATKVPDKVLIQEIEERCFPQCTLHEDPGYVIYSAVGSFYAPMLVMIYFNFRIYRTATKTTKAIRQGWTKVKGVGGDDAGAGMGIHRGGGAAAIAAAAVGASAAGGRPSVSAAGSRRPSASARQCQSVAGSRRTSAVCLNGGPPAAALRRQQTLAHGGTSARTLPRQSALSGGSVTATNGGLLAVGRPSLADPRRRRGSGGSENFLSRPLLSPTAETSKEPRRLSISANSLHVPPNDLECRLSALVAASRGAHHGSPHPSARQRVSSTTRLHKTSAGGGGEGLRASSASGGLSRPPNVSHHQPCPNHIAGKTFSEQGTQTNKEDKVLIVSREGRDGRRALFRWRSSAVNRNEAGGNGAGGAGVRGDSPSSMEKAAAAAAGSRRRVSLRGCFRFHRWKLMLTGRRVKTPGHSGGATSDSEGSGGEGGSGGQNTGSVRKTNRTTSQQGSTDELSGSVRVLVQHGAQGGASTPSSAAGAHKFGKRNIKSQVR
jgi:hypothetical protein